MRFTQDLRDAVIKAVMLDTPMVDYAEKARKLMLDAAVANLPPAIRKLYQDPKLSGWIRQQIVWLNGFSASVPALVGSTFTVPEDVNDELLIISEATSVQFLQRKDLQTKLNAALSGLNTIKQVRDTFPEFAKYLPDEKAASKNLPAVANIVSDLVKAGWPKK